MKRRSPSFSAAVLGLAYTEVRLVNTISDKSISCLIKVIADPSIKVKIVMFNFAFFSRMWLDAKNADLADEIRQKQAVLSATSDFETIFKNNQQKLSLLHDLFAMEGTKSHIFESVVASTPEDIVLSAYSDSDSGIAITGDSPTEMSIAQFLVNLKAIKAVTSVNLTQIKIDQDSSLLSFSISLGAEGK